MANFDRERVLGIGRYGLIFKDIWNKKPVAIKQVKLIYIDQQGEEALQRLEHPNVIKLFHAESDKNLRYYYLELCNASLDRLFYKEEHPMKYRGPMSPPLTVLYQLALGLEYIHKMGLIHRDLKPENVLIWVDPEERQVLMKWADFGLSKPVNERESYSAELNKGTFEWLAPELLKLFDDEQPSQPGRETTESTNRETIKSDVFTEGLVFGYFLLNGVHLFGLRHQIPSNILQNKPVNLDNIQSKCARDLIIEMLKENVADRITSSKVTEVLRFQSELETQFFDLYSRDTYPSLEEVKKILKEGVEINCTNEKGLTPLLSLLATEKKNEHDTLIEIVQLLIQRGIDINCKTKHRDNALTLLCRYYDKENIIDIIRFLIEHGIEVNCKNNYGDNALTLLCWKYQKENLIEIIPLLIQHGIEVNWKTKYRDNALTLLCWKYNKDNLVEIIQMLIEKSIKVNWKTKYRDNALTLLCRYYKRENIIDIIRLLFENGIEVNCKNNHSDNALTLLCWKYQQWNLIEIIRILIQRGIEVNCKDKWGYNALILLCWKYPNENLIEIIRLLIENGIDVNFEDSKGDNALIILCRYYHNVNLIEIIRLLIKNGCKVTAYTQTQLQKSVRVEKREEILQLLADTSNSQALH